jgi:hypothetical protein
VRSDGPLAGPYLQCQKAKKMGGNNYQRRSQPDRTRFMRMLGSYSENETTGLFLTQGGHSLQSPASPILRRLTALSRLPGNCREHRLMRAGSPRRQLDRADQLSGQWSEGPPPARPDRKIQVKATLRCEDNQQPAAREEIATSLHKPTNTSITINKFPLTRLWHSRNPARNILV